MAALENVFGHQPDDRFVTRHVRLREEQNDETEDRRSAEDQKKRLRRIAAENEKLLASVRAFPLENWDPPANVLKLYPDRAPRPIRASTAIPSISSTALAPHRMPSQISWKSRRVSQ